jgi:hypothetical protein
LKKPKIIFIIIFLGLLPGKLFAQLGGYAAILGENGYFETTDTLWDGMSDLTIEGYYTPCDDEKTANLFTIGDVSNGLQLTNHMDTFMLYLRNNPNNIDTSILFTASISFSEWNHFALVYKIATTSLTIYINGQFARSIILPLPVSPGFRIGSDTTFNEYFRGRIDNYRLSSEAVYSTNFNPFSTPITTGQQTLAFWQFDAPGQDSIIFDASANQKHLTIWGMVEFNYPLSDSLSFTQCGNDTIQLFVSGGSSYQWNPVDFLDDPTSASPRAFPPGNFTYQVEAMSSYGCKPDTGTVVITQFPKPVVKISAEKDSICLGESIELTASGALYYLWSPVQFVDTVYKKTVIASPEETTDFILRGVDENSCIAFDTLSIFVDSCSNSLLPYKLSSLLIYPNPTTGQIYLDFPDQAVYQISIHNMAGQQVFHQKNTKNLLQLDLEEGLYIITVTNETNQVYRTKLIIRK